MPHTSNGYLAGLGKQFQENLIRRRCNVKWAPHLPDMNFLNFYMWLYLKDNVFHSKFQTIGEQKALTTAKVRKISKDKYVLVINNFCDVCKFASSAVFSFAAYFK